MRIRLPVIAVGVLLLIPSMAAAHATLEVGNPGPGASIDVAPHRLELLFDEAVLARYAQVAVVGAGGRELAEAPRVAGRVVVVPLWRAAAASYTVRWRMVSADDGHTTAGAYSFGVRTKPLPPAPLPGVGVPLAPQLLSWLEFLGVALAGGMLAFRALLWAPMARTLGDGAPRDALIAIWVGAAGAVIALHAGVLAFLTSAYPIVGGSFLDFVHVQFQTIRASTPFGQAWTVTSFAWLGVIGMLVAAWVTPRRREALLAAAGVAALGIGFGLSWASHAAATGTVALTVDYLHLLAAALWTGGLLWVAILAWVLRPVAAPARDSVVRACLLRFSQLALPVVAALALAGLYLALRELRAPSALLSGYGIVLLVKTGIAAGALTLGGYHRRYVVPTLAAGAPVAAIKRTLALEVGLVVAALAAAAVLSQTAPPR